MYPGQGDTPCSPGMGVTHPLDGGLPHQVLDEGGGGYLIQSSMEGVSQSGTPIWT